MKKVTCIIISFVTLIVGILIGGLGHKLLFSQDVVICEEKDCVCEKTKCPNEEYLDGEYLEYEYFDMFIPGETYTIKINKKTKELNGEFYHACSALDCDGQTYKYTITLTDDEYNKIVQIWDDKENLSPILESLCEDNEIMYESFEDSYEDSKEDYNNIDTNKDGKISHREFGNHWLDTVLAEQ